MDFDSTQGQPRLLSDSYCSAGSKCIRLWQQRRKPVVAAWQHGSSREGTQQPCNILQVVLGAQCMVLWGLLHVHLSTSKLLLVGQARDACWGFARSACSTAVPDDASCGKQGCLWSWCSAAMALCLHCSYPGISSVVGSRLQGQYGLGDGTGSILAGTTDCFLVTCLVLASAEDADGRCVHMVPIAAVLQTQACDL